MKNISRCQWLVFVGCIFLTACSNKFGGMTLYTVRNEMKTDPKGVITKVAEMGYKNIEATDYTNRKFYGLTPVEFKDYLKSLGLNQLVLCLPQITQNLNK